MARTSSRYRTKELAAAIGSNADRIRRNVKFLTHVHIQKGRPDDLIDIFDALKNNTVVKTVSISSYTDNLLQLNQEARGKLSEVMQCNKSVESLTMCLGGGSLRERNQLFATMATIGGWSSIKELVLYKDDSIESLSLMEAEHLSSFIIQSENLRTLTLEASGDETGPILEALSRTKVQSLKIFFSSTFSVQNAGRHIATALERCTCIADLRLNMRHCNDLVESFQILLVESIPKMLGLKKFELDFLNRGVNKQFFDMVGQCIGEHQGGIEELKLLHRFVSSVNSSIVGLAPALRRLKVIRFHGYFALSLPAICELSGIAADCYSLEEFDCGPVFMVGGTRNLVFKAICRLLSKFPSLKRLTHGYGHRLAGPHPVIALHEESRFVAFLDMVKTSKTIEQIPLFECRKAEEGAAIKQQCHNNMMHNRLELIHEKSFLAAKVTSSAWQLILKEFSDMPDVLYYLLQQKHGAMIGPT